MRVMRQSSVEVWNAECLLDNDAFVNKPQKVISDIWQIWYHWLYVVKLDKTKQEYNWLPSGLYLLDEWLEGA